MNLLSTVLLALAMSTDAFAAALQQAKDKTFPDLTLSVIDPNKPQDPAHCSP